MRPSELRGQTGIFFPQISFNRKFLAKSLGKTETRKLKQQTLGLELNFAFKNSIFELFGITLRERAEKVLNLLKDFFYYVISHSKNCFKT